MTIVTVKSTHTYQPANRRYFTVLSILLMLFCFRVLGQALVAFVHVSFLPPMQEWFSGLLPYPELLACQIFIIALYGKVCLDFERGKGFFITPNAALGRFLVRFGSLYLIAMMMRYIIRMTLYPAERWVGGSIPIFFHWILAAFLLVLGIYHYRNSPLLPKNTLSSTRSRFESTAWIVAFAGVLLWATWQLIPSIIGYQLGLRRSQYAVRVEKHVSMMASDGVVLTADVFHPEHELRTPTILVRIPLTKSLKTSFYEDLMGRIWAERGYTVVVQGIRGRFESGGPFYPLRGERRDGIEALKWISKQDWFNGQIATWGGSAFGYTQLVISDQINPGPSALDVYEASTDFHEMFYPGGAFSLYSALSWAINSHGKTDLPEWPASDNIARGAIGWPLIDADKRALGIAVPFFKDWVQHSERDGYWSDIDGSNRVAHFKAPALLMAGWYDPFLPTQLKDFVELRSTAPKLVATRSRLIIGPWTHAGEVTFPDSAKSIPFRAQSLAESLPWFDEILQTGNGKFGQHSAVKIFVMGKNKWRDEQEWPLARARYTAFYLHSNGLGSGASNAGKLIFSAPLSDEQDDQYVYDPSDPVPTAGGAMIGRAAGIASQNQLESRRDVTLLD